MLTLKIGSLLDRYECDEVVSQTLAQGKEINLDDYKNNYFLRRNDGYWIIFESFEAFRAYFSNYEEIPPASYTK